MRPTPVREGPPLLVGDAHVSSPGRRRIRPLLFAAPAVALVVGGFAAVQLGLALALQLVFRLRW